MPNKDLTLSVAESMLPVFKGVVEPIANEDEAIKVVKGDLSEQDENALRLATRIMKSLNGKMDEGRFNLLAASAGYKAPAPKDMIAKADHEAAVKKAVDEAVAKAKAEKPGARTILKSADGTQYDVTDMDAGPRAVIETLVKKSDERHAETEVLKAATKRRDLIEKAAKDFPNLDTAAVADVLLKTEGLDADAAKKLTEVLKQAEALAKAGGIGEIGKNGGGGGGSGSYAKLQTMAAGLVLKAEGKMSPEKAFSEVLKTDEGKKLYEQYLAEQQ